MTMYYSIYIGEAQVDAPGVDDDGLELSVRVFGMQHPEAPEFPGDNMTGKSNVRHPGYSQWATFCRETGLYELFLDKVSGLMFSHPGCVVIRKEHHERIVKALRDWQVKAVGKVPGWDPTVGVFGAGNPDPKYDGNLARLMWLEWWFRWALKNCKIPALYNR
jgi:hypothetical protein